MYAKMGKWVMSQTSKEDLGRTRLSLASVPANRTASVLISIHNPPQCVKRFTYLEIDNNEDDHNSSQQIAKIWCILPVERVLEGVNFVRLGE